MRAFAPVKRRGQWELSRRHDRSPFGHWEHVALFGPIRYKGVDPFGLVSGNENCLVALSESGMSAEPSYACDAEFLKLFSGGPTSI